MSKNELIKSNLSLVSRNISVIDALNSKMQEIQENNQPVEMFTDFVASELDLLEQKKEQLKNYKEIITKQIKDLEMYEKEAKEDVATYLAESGIDKLEGIVTSSMTISKGSSASEEIKTKIVRLPIYSKADEEEALIDAGICEYKDEIITKEAKNASVRINKRRV